MQVAQLGGPALAGVLIATVDLAWVYAFDLATFAGEHGIARKKAEDEAWAARAAQAAQ
jgi:hypothetical protein